MERRLPLWAEALPGPPSNQDAASPPHPVTSFLHLLLLFLSRNLFVNGTWHCAVVIFKYPYTCVCAWGGVCAFSPTWWTQFGVVCIRPHVIAQYFLAHYWTNVAPNENGTSKDCNDLRAVRRVWLYLPCVCVSCAFLNINSNENDFKQGEGKMGEKWGSEDEKGTRGKEVGDSIQQIHTASSSPAVLIQCIKRWGLELLPATLFVPIVSSSSFECVCVCVCLCWCVFSWPSWLQSLGFGCV